MTTTRTLHPGCKPGDDVERAETLLRDLGYFHRKPGRSYGKPAQAAVRAFKADHKLPHDRILGPRAWAELEKAYAANARRKPRPVDGFDVSNLQGGIDFGKAKAGGYEFVYVKAGEGDWNDPMFLRNVKAAAAAKLKVGAYHFLRPQPARTGAQEAQFFIANLREAGLGKGDLRPVLDCEHVDPKTSRPLLAGTKLRVYVQSFVEALRKAGHDPIVYTGTWWWEPFIGARDFGCPLWIAAYQSAQPHLPAPWKHYVAWQHSSTMSVPGVRGECDVDRAPDLRELVA